MFGQSTPKSRETFIVRLWREEDTQSDWKGEVLHVRSGETFHIKGILSLNQFFTEYFDSETIPQKYGLK